MKPPPIAPVVKKAADAAAQKAKEALPPLPAKPPLPPLPPLPAGPSLLQPPSDAFKKPGSSPSAVALAAARAQVETLLIRVKRSPVGGSKEVAALEGFLVELIARGGSYAEFVESLSEQARAYVEQHHPMVDRALNLARLLSSPYTRKRYLNEVVVLAKSGRITGPAAIAATNAIVGKEILRDPSTAPPPGFTLFPTVSGEVSTVLGLQYSAGICGLMHGAIGYADTATVSIGAQAGISAAASVYIGRGTPADLNGITLCIALGFTYGAGFDISVSYGFDFLAPDFRNSRFVTHATGISVGITGGGDAELAVGIEFGRAYMLPLT